MFLLIFHFVLSRSCLEIGFWKYITFCFFTLTLINYWLINLSLPECLLLNWVSLSDFILVFVLFVHLLLFERFLSLGQRFNKFGFLDFDFLGAFTSLMLMRLFTFELFFNVIQIVLVEMRKYIVCWVRFDRYFLLWFCFVFCFRFLSPFCVIQFRRLWHVNLTSLIYFYLLRLINEFPKLTILWLIEQYKLLVHS